MRRHIIASHEHWRYTKTCVKPALHFDHVVVSCKSYRMRDAIRVRHHPLSRVSRLLDSSAVYMVCRPACQSVLVRSKLLLWGFIYIHMPFDYSAARRNFCQEHYSMHGVTLNYYSRSFAMELNMAIVPC